MFRIKSLAEKTTLVFVLGSFLMSTACVKQHRDLVSDDMEGKYALPELNPSDTDVTNNLGEKFQVLSSGTYYVQDDYVGCEDSDRKVGSLSSDGNKIVVPLASGKTAACVKPSALAKMKEQPQVTFYKAPQGTEYYIQTREKIRTSGRTEAIDLNVSGDIGIQLLDIVDYTTNSPILAAVRDRIEFRALPGETYKVYHKITPRILYIMKVAAKSKLSHLDLPIADNLGNGEYAVPIAAVRISTFKYVNRRNGDGEQTNVYDLLPTESLKNTTHIKFDYNDIQPVDLPPDIAKDLYPADYFTQGQWYASESVIDTRPGSEGLIGTQTGAVDSRFKPASRVQFSRTGAGLIACNVGIDERYSEDFECQKSHSVFVLPASGHAFRLDKDSTSVEEVRMQSVEAPFIQLQMTQISSFWKSIDELVSLFRDTNEDQLIEVNFSKDKFNFITQRGANGRHVIYSFLRADNRPKYTPKRHYKDDRLDKFGYFVQEKARINSSDVIHRPEDLEKEYLVQRHNPTQPIYFYFSSITPEYNEQNPDPYGLEIDYREIGTKAVEYWNAAFERAGAPNRLVLGEGSRQYGDISFNTMNLIDSEQGSNLLGVGPSLVDPYTGEVINTNANVYIAPFREIVAGRVRNYIKAELGFLDKHIEDLPAGATTNSTILGDLADYNSGIKDKLATFMPEHMMKMIANFYHKGYALFNPRVDMSTGYAKNGDQVVDLYNMGRFDVENTMVQALLKIAKKVPELVWLRDQGQITFDLRSRNDLSKLQRAMETHRPTLYRMMFMSENVGDFNQYDSMNREIKERCSAVAGLIEKVKARTPKGGVYKLSTEEELPALRHCLTKIIPDKFMATLVHEMGHNLGLRHNFKASADKENFYTKEEVKEIYGISLRDQDLPKSSSVMDYVRSEQDRLYFPGHYDIAAIRYGYANSVEVADSAERPNSLNGNYVNLDTIEADLVEGSVEDKLAKIGKEARDFGFCTDVEASLQIDPMCDRHDFGTSPQMVVNDVINSFWESFTLYNFRYDRTGAGITSPFRRRARLDKLKRIYDEWRIELASYLGKEDSTGNVYLQRYSDEDYAELIEKLKADENFRGKDYLAVRDQIFNFILDVAFFPNQYCLVYSKEAGPKAYELSRLKEELKNQVPVGTKVFSCDSPEIQTLISDKGFDYMLETGLPVDNTWYYVNPRDTFFGDYTSDTVQVREPLDAVGTFFDRSFAAGLLGSRQGSYYTTLIEQVFPNMMDEPDLYALFEKKMVSRLTEGVDLKEAFENSNGISFSADSEIVLPNFAAEASLIKALWLSLEFGVRNDYADVSRRVSRFSRWFSDNPSTIQDAVEEGAELIPMTDGSFLIVPPDSEAVFPLVEAMKTAAQTLNASEQTLPEFEEIYPAMDDFMAKLSAVLEVKEEVSAEESPQVEAEADSTVDPATNADAQIKEQRAERAAAQVEEVEPGLEEPARAATITAKQYYVFASNLFNVMETQMDAVSSAVMNELYIEDLLIYLIEIYPIDAGILESQADEKEPSQEDLAALDKKLKEIDEEGWDAVVAKVKIQLALMGYDGPVTVPTQESVASKFKDQGKELTEKILEEAQASLDAAKADVALNGDELEAQYELLRAILIYNFNDIGQDFSLRLAELFTDLRDPASYDLLIKKSKYAKAFARENLSLRALLSKGPHALSYPAQELLDKKK